MKVISFKNMLLFTLSVFIILVILNAAVTFSADEGDSVRGSLAPPPSTSSGSCPSDPGKITADVAQTCDASSMDDGQLRSFMGNQHVSPERIAEIIKKRCSQKDCDLSIIPDDKLTDALNSISRGKIAKFDKSSYPSGTISIKGSTIKTQNSHLDISSLSSKVTIKVSEKGEMEIGNPKGNTENVDLSGVDAKNVYFSNVNVKFKDGSSAKVKDLKFDGESLFAPKGTYGYLYGYDSKGVEKQYRISSTESDVFVYIGSVPENKKTPYVSFFDKSSTGDYNQIKASGLCKVEIGSEFISLNEQKAEALIDQQKKKIQVSGDVSIGKGYSKATFEKNRGVVYPNTDFGFQGYSFKYSNEPGSSPIQTGKINEDGSVVVQNGNGGPVLVAQQSGNYGSGQNNVNCYNPGQVRDKQVNCLRGNFGDDTSFKSCIETARAMRMNPC